MKFKRNVLGSGYNAVYQPDPNKLPNAVFWLKTYPERLKQHVPKVVNFSYGYM